MPPQLEARQGKTGTGENKLAYRGFGAYAHADLSLYTNF